MLSIAKCWRAKCLSLWRLCIHLLVATFSGTTYCDIKQNSSRLFHGTHQWMFCFKMASTIKLEDMLGFIITISNPISKWCFQNIIIINAKGVKKCHKYTIFFYLMAQVHYIFLSVLYQFTYVWIGLGSKYISTLPRIKHFWCFTALLYRPLAPFNSCSLFLLQQKH